MDIKNFLRKLIFFFKRTWIYRFFSIKEGDLIIFKNDQKNIYVLGKKGFLYHLTWTNKNLEDRKILQKPINIFKKPNLLILRKEDVERILNNSKDREILVFGHSGVPYDNKK